MRYASLLVLGFFKAILWSGGFYWRPLLLVGILPGYREKLRPVLEALTIYQLPDSYFYLFAVVTAVAVFAGRIAYLETPRVALRTRKGAPFEVLDTLPNGDKRRRWLLGVTNIGLQEVAHCSVEMLELTDEDNTFYAFAHISLRTEHQEVGEFHLNAGATKMVKVVSLIESRPEQQIEIHYASTHERTPNALPPDRKYLITIGVSGAGTLVRRKFLFRVENGRLMFSPQRGLRAFGWNIMIDKCT